jgi:hypothetical protein
MRATDKSKVHPLYRRIMDLAMKTWKVDETALYLLLNSLSLEKIKQLRAIEVQAREEIGHRSWDHLLTVKFPHLSKDENWVFSPEIPGVGDRNSVDPGTSTWNEDRRLYEQTTGASMRMIVELGKVTKIWLSLPGVNRNYDKSRGQGPWLDWRNCQYTATKL